MSGCFLSRFFLWRDKNAWYSTALISLIFGEGIDLYNRLNDFGFSFPSPILIGLTQLEDLTGFRKRLQAKITPYSTDFHQNKTL
jgi:hypothetical protein